MTIQLIKEFTTRILFSFYKTFTSIQLFRDIPVACIKEYEPLTIPTKKVTDLVSGEKAISAYNWGVHVPMGSMKAREEPEGAIPNLVLLRGWLTASYTGPPGCCFRLLIPDPWHTAECESRRDVHLYQASQIWDKSLCQQAWGEALAWRHPSY